MQGQDKEMFVQLEKLKYQGKFLLAKQCKNSIMDWIVTSVPNKEIKYDMELVEELLITKSPFIYLNRQERELIKSTSTVVEITGSEKEVFSRKNHSNYHMMLLLEGEIFAIDPKCNYCEALHVGDSFGADACLFGETDYSILTASLITKILMIPTSTFLQLLNCEKQFTLILGRNMLYKQKIFSALEKFNSYTAESSNIGEVNIQKLVKIYKKINSSLHPYRKSKNIDISAWNYAIQRLPENLTSTFVFHLSNSLPGIFEKDEKISEVNSKSRKRTVYKTLSGKNVVVLRDMESDLNDFLSNLCIHFIEAKKLRRKLKLPTVLNILTVTENIEHLDLDISEIQGIKEIWKEKAVENIRNIILHHEDYRVIVTTSSANLRAGPSERWTETLWEGCQSAIGAKLSVSKAIQSGLVVDVLQGSSNTLLNLISPYFKINAEKIKNWFSTSGITLKTQEFYQDHDKIFAMGYYYLKQFPEEAAEKKRLESEVGIITITDTEMTGVKVMIVNVNKSKAIGFHPKSPMHIIINIGYTFGKQGYDIIKCFNLLFENCIDSFSFIGKAGGLVGNRKDVLISTKFHDVTTKAMTLVNPSGLDLEYFAKLGIPVHKGPMLTVSGTILQNEKLLKYYRHIEGCVGLEMEGCYFAQGIQLGIEMGLLKETVPTRFLYYVSDIPLDPDSNLAQEEGNVNWDEGIPTMSAITEHCLNLCADVVCEKMNDRLSKFIHKFKKVAIVQKEWKIAEFLISQGFAVACFVNYSDDLPSLNGNFITVDYLESHEYFGKIENAIRCLHEEDTARLVVVMHNPEERDFWIPVKAEHTMKIRYNTVKVAKNYANFKRKNAKLFLVSNNDCESLIFEGLHQVLKPQQEGYLSFSESGSVFMRIPELFSNLD